MAIPITDNVVRLPGKVLGALGRLVAWLGESPIKKLGNRVLAVRYPFIYFFNYSALVECAEFSWYSSLLAPWANSPIRS